METAQTPLSLFMSKYHIVGNHMSRLNYHVAAHEVLVLIASASIKGLCESAHMHILAKDFASHKHKVWKKK